MSNFKGYFNFTHNFILIVLKKLVLKILNSHLKRNCYLKHPHIKMRKLHLQASGLLLHVERKKMTCTHTHLYIT